MIRKPRRPRPIFVYYRACVGVGFRSSFVMAVPLCPFCIESHLICSIYLKYSKTCLKRPLKKKTKLWFTRPIIA